MKPSAARERFGRDDFSRRLGAIAANLSRIRSFIERGAGEPLIRNLIDESKMFIEDAARSASVDVAAQLADLQRQLARWSRALDAILSDDREKGELARLAAEWSDRLLKLSGMLDAPVVGSKDSALVVPHRHKYGVIAFPGVWSGIDVVVSGGFVASSRPPFVLSDFWVRRVGEDYAEAFRDAGFYVMKTESSVRPEVLDQENRRLMDAVDGFRLALAVASPRFRTRESIGATGGNPDGEALVISTFRYPPVRRSPASRREQVSIDDVRRAAALVGALASIPRAARLWKAIVSYSRALGYERGDDRLHEFVRCIEGFIAPDPGKTKRQFQGRVGSIVEDADSKVLGEIFELRSAVEHLNDPGEVLANREDATFFRRVDESEAIARYCVLTVLENSALLDVFKHDAGIRAFWGESGHARRDQWGPALRLGEALSSLRYDDETSWS